MYNSKLINYKDNIFYKKLHESVGSKYKNTVSGKVLRW